MLVYWFAGALNKPRPGITVNQLALSSPLATNNDAGMTTQAVVDLAGRYGLQLNLTNTLTLDVLDSEVKANRPVFVYITYGEIVERHDPDPFGHFVVVV